MTSLAVPKRLWITRHGQSAGNVARDAAEAAGLQKIDIADRDVDVPLSDLGVRQSRALADWFGALPVAEQPTVVFYSPYVRAHQTAQHVIDRCRATNESLIERCDERLREKEFGILDRLTIGGIKQLHPELSEQRAHVGKFYFRPPGGESWCDVILRLRSAWNMIVRDYADQRVLIVAHQVTVLCLRYLIEEMDEATILAIDRKGDIPNCSVTQYDASARDPHRMALAIESLVAPLEATGTPVTREADVPMAAKP